MALAHRIAALIIAVASHGAMAAVTVQQSTDDATGAANFTVANGLYRVEWVQPREATPTIARAWAGTTVPLGSLFQVSWGKVKSGTLRMVENGPLRAVLEGEFQVARAGDETVTDTIRMRIVHWEADPRIAVTCDFALGKDYTNWILCSNYLRLGDDVAHPDVWAAGPPGPTSGEAPPLSAGPVPDGKREALFDFDRPWGEVYRAEPADKAAGVGAFTDAHGMRAEHNWSPANKTYSQYRWLWSYFRMNNALQGKYRQSFTLVVHPGAKHPDSGQSWTGTSVERFLADGTPKGVWVSAVQPVSQTVSGKRVRCGKVEVIEELGLSRSTVPVTVALPADFPRDDLLRVWAEGVPGAGALQPTALAYQLSADRTTLLSQLPRLLANQLATIYVTTTQQGGVATVAATQRPVPLADPFSWRVDLPIYRLNYLRGETLPLRVELPPGASGLKAASGRVIVMPEVCPSEPRWAPPSRGAGPAMTLPFKIAPQGERLGAVIPLETSHLASGEYRLIAELTQPGTTTAVRKVIRARVCPVSTYRFELGGWHGDYRSQAEHNLSSCLLADPQDMDDCLRLGMRFSLRTDVYYNIELAQKQPEVRMKRPDGSDLPLHVDRSKPTPCLLNRLEREAAVAAQRQQVSAARHYPAFSRYVYTSDDVQLFDWCCYCDTCQARFHEVTGLTPPQPPTPDQSKACRGVVSEEDPWLRWNLFRCGEVYAGYNQALVEATRQLVPEVKLGAVSGPMQRPLMYPIEGLNPSQDQGAWTLLSYYYYPHYLFPLASNIFYTELARLGGRGKDSATLGDCAGEVVEQVHLRNSFYNLLAGGNRSLQFFTWRDRRPETTEELTVLGQVTRRYGNLFLEIERSPKPIGLLCSFTTAIHDSEWAHGSAQGSFLNMLCAHVEAEPVGEEEIIAGAADRYRAIVLADVGWLRQACSDALAQYVRGGGVVLTDATTAVRIPGATTVDFSIPGTIHRPADGMDPLAFTYAEPGHVAKVRDAMRLLAVPFAEADRPLLHLRRFQGAGATYLWAVNAFSREEFDYLFRNCQFWQGEDKWIGRTKLAEYLRSRGGYGDRFSATVTIPAGSWAVYDVLSGQYLPTRPEGDRTAFTVDVQRFGGTLIALYPSAVARVEVRCPTQSQGQPMSWEVRVLDAQGKPVDALEPLELEVTDPQGRATEYGGSFVARGGVLALDRTFAANDLPGAWRVRVTELASGKTGECTFRRE